MSYESLPEGEKAEVAALLRNVAKDLPADQHPIDETFELETGKPDALPGYLRGSADTSRTIDGQPLSTTGGDSVGPALDEVTSDLRSPHKAEVATSLRKVTKDLPVHQPEGEKAEVSYSLQSVTKGLPVDQPPVDKETFELETGKSDTLPDYLWGSVDTSSTTEGQPLSTTGGDSVGPALEGVTSGLRSSPISTEPADPGPLPTRTTVDQAEGPAVRNSDRVSYMLAALYSSFLASIRPMGVLLSPRTVLPRLEEQNDETEVTQELSQAQRRLVVEEGGIWKQLLEVTSKEGAEGDVLFLARELEDKSAKILTSYERRNNPPTNEVYNQSRIILEAMGVPCVNTKGGVEGEALAAAIVRDGLADYVASEDTVSLLPSF